MKRTLLAVLNSTAAIAFVLAASPASAQQNDAQTGIQTQRQQNQNQRYQGQRNLSAAEFVRRAAIGNLFEIRSSQLATSRANNDEVS